MKSNVLISRFISTLDRMDKEGIRVPGLLLSHAGFGKTSTVRMYAKYHDYNCVELIPSQYAADDIVGIQAMDINKGELVRKSPSWFRGLKELMKNGKRTVLFIDEITTCSPYIQGPLLDLIFSRSLGEEKLPDNVFIVAAGNYASDLNGEFTMSNPLVNRFVLLNLDETDFDIMEILDETFRDVSSHEEIERYLELDDDKRLSYDYNQFRNWIYESKNIGFGTYAPEEIEGIGLVGFTSIRSLDFSIKYAKAFMEHYADDSWMRVVGDTLGTCAKKEGKPLRTIIKMHEDKFCKAAVQTDLSLGEVLNFMLNAPEITIEDLAKLKKVATMTPAKDITDNNLHTLINIIKSKKKGTENPVMSECVTLLTNKCSEV